MTAFLNKASLPLLLAVLIFSGCTAARLATDPAAPWLRFLLWQGNISARGGNLATWFQAAMFLGLGLSFAPLAWGRAFPLRSVFLRAVYSAAGLACLFFCLDEILLVHKKLSRIMESRSGIEEALPILSGGYAWLAVYGAAALGGAAVLVRSHLKVAAAVPRESGLRGRAAAFFAAAIAALVLDIAAELGEAAVKDQEAKRAVFAWFEETMELAAVFCLIRSNTLISRGLAP